MKEIFTTTTTYLGKDLYGCRVIFIENNILFAELRVTKDQIGNAFFDILRTACKLGYISPMAIATRERQKGKLTTAKFIWG